MTPHNERITRIKMELSLTILLKSDVSLLDTLLRAWEWIYYSALSNVIFMQTVAAPCAQHFVHRSAATWRGLSPLLCERFRSLRVRRATSGTMEKTMRYIRSCHKLSLVPLIGRWLCVVLVNHKAVSVLTHCIVPAPR